MHTKNQFPSITAAKDSWERLSMPVTLVRISRSDNGWMDLLDLSTTASQTNIIYHSQYLLYMWLYVAHSGSIWDGRFLNVGSLLPKWFSWEFFLAWLVDLDKRMESISGELWACEALCDFFWGGIKGCVNKLDLNYMSTVVEECLSCFLSFFRSPFILIFTLLLWKFKICPQVVAFNLDPGFLLLAKKHVIRTYTWI